MKITSASHLDHALSPAHIAWIQERFGAVESFTLETVELPESLASLPCALFGPMMGDAPIGEDRIRYVQRGDRPGKSRMLADGTAPRTVRKLSVIIGPHEGETILYTAFGGPVAPREPFDPSLTPEQKAESEAFWKDHALAQ